MSLQLLRFIPLPEHVKPGGFDHDVFDTSTLTWLETVPTEKGAHTIAFDAQRNKVYAFLPQTHRSQVFRDA
jgi:hypothetical protein